MVGIAARRPPDFRSVGTMSQFLRELLGRAGRGYSREEIREILRSHPQFAAVMQRRGTFSGVLYTMVRRRELVEIGGLIYARGQEPVPNLPGRRILAETGHPH